jgi:hypothetical protein
MDAIGAAAISRESSVEKYKRDHGSLPNAHETAGCGGFWLEGGPDLV